MTDQQEIITAVYRFISEEHSSDDQFNELALTLFAYQFQFNLPFQAYCRQTGKTPRTVKRWQEIPAVPLDAFKEFTLSCSDSAQAARVFMTSGTTQGRRGKHFHPTTAVYDLSMIKNFHARFMRTTDRIRMGILFPAEDELPNSSLAHYLALAVREFGAEDSGYFIAESGLALESLLRELEQAEKSREPYALLGASYSFVHLFEALEQRGRTFALAKGSRILDTGGFKNQSREMDAEEFYDRLAATFGVARGDCLNMYGMTELSTQFYDEGNARVPSVKAGPHWIRTRVVNPLTGQDIPKGEPGILIHCDLANFNSVTTILTEDIGIEAENGFQLLGRAQGREAQGCSITAEEYLQGRKGRT